MSAKSEIEWTDATWNPVRGCTKVSAGCKNCYAETFAERWRGIPGHPFEQGFDLKLVPEKLGEPLKWKKPRRIFVNSMSDMFHEEVPDSFIDQVLAVAALTREHTYQILTKRAGRMLKYFSRQDLRQAIAQAAVQVSGSPCADFVGDEVWPLPNVWLGVSVEDQQRADERIPLLLQTPAAVRFLSCEPLLGPVSFRWAKWMQIPSQHDGSLYHLDGMNGLHWVIVGGESGRKRRPMKKDWVYEIKNQCQEAKVAFFMKQIDKVLPIPDDLMIREFP